MGPHQRLLLESQLRHLDFLDEEVTRMDQEVAQRMGPFGEALQRLDTIPGVGRRTAELLLAEIGPEMSRFPTARNLASWARVCPGTNESAGKRKSGRMGRGNPWLRSTLVEAAWGAARSRRTYLSAQYHRLAARRGGKRAVVAVAHTILVMTYHLLRDATVYRELGADYFDHRNREATMRRSVRRLERLGYKVSLEAA
ncbi:MAG: transposase [Dehalococcoidia bacterium]